MAERISRRAYRSSRSRSARTRARAIGTAIVVRIIMIVKATISSTSVSPLWFLRRILRILLHGDCHLRAAGKTPLPLGVADREIGDRHGPQRPGAGGFLRQP